jgi:tetratricopeptide (TPR) repeat protein
MHRSVAEVLAAAGAPPGELAHHWAAAYKLEKALPALIAAAGAAEKVSAFDDARQHLELALELWDDVADAETCAGISQVDLLRRLAEMRNLLGDSAGAAMLAEIALAGVDEEVDPELAGAILERLSRYRWVDGEGAASLDAGTAAVDIIPPEPPTRERAKALAALASLMMLTARFASSLDYADLAIDAARRADVPAVEGHAFTTRGTVIGLVDDVDAGLVSIRRGRALSEQEGAIDDLLRSYANASSVLHQGGRYQEAIVEAQSAAALAGKFGLGSWVMAMRGNAAEALFDLGRWDEAAELVSAEVVGGESAVSVLMEARVGARLAIGRGEYEEAARQLERSGELEERVVDPQFIGPHHHIAALLARSLGRPGEAAALVRSGLEKLGASEDLFHFDALHEVGIAAAADMADTGELDDELMADAEGWWVTMAAQPPGHGEAPARRATAFAQLGRVTGDDDPDRWREAVAAWDELSRPHEAAYARWRLAIVLEATGPGNEEADEALGRAAEAARRLGAAPLLAHIEATRSR